MRLKSTVKPLPFQFFDQLDLVQTLPHCSCDHDHSRGCTFQTLFGSPRPINECCENEQLLYECDLETHVSSHTCEVDAPTRTILCVLSLQSHSTPSRTLMNSSTANLVNENNLAKIFYSYLAIKTKTSRGDNRHAHDSLRKIKVQEPRQELR